jgi:AcrR family transcriptional regulator
MFSGTPSDTSGSATPGSLEQRGAAARRRVPRVERQQQMLDVAARVFAERGYHAASMDEIAAEVGVSKPMLYAYFDSKEGLYLACIDRAGQDLLESMRRAAGEGLSPEDRLWAGILAFFEFVDERREGWSVLFHEASTRGGPFAAEVAQLRARISGIVDELLAEAAAAHGIAPAGFDTTEPLAHALVGAGESLANWWLEHPAETKEAVALRLMNFAWVGLGGLVSGQAWLPASAQGTAAGGGRDGDADRH